MRRTLIFAVLIAAVFIVTYTMTANIWTATNGAGIIAAIFVTGVAIRIIRLFDRRWQKVAAMTISAVMIVGLGAHWIITWKTSEWQYTELLKIRRVIYNGVALSTLKDPALETFREFRRSSSGGTVDSSFRRLYPPGVPFADSTIAKDDGPFFESVSDSMVELTEEAWHVPGFDTAFINHDGRRGLAQISIRVTREGAFYAIQN